MFKICKMLWLYINSFILFFFFFYCWLARKIGLVAYLSKIGSIFQEGKKMGVKKIMEEQQMEKDHYKLYSMKLFSSTNSESETAVTGVQGYLRNLRTWLGGGREGELSCILAKDFHLRKKKNCKGKFYRRNSISNSAWSQSYIQEVNSV